MSFHSNIIRARLNDVPALNNKALAYIGVGSNLGANASSPEQTLEQAFLALASLSAFPIVVSSLWESQPVDCPPGSPLFVNAVAALSPTATEPLVLLRELQRIEQEFGRCRTGQRNAPRTLDLDFLSFSDVKWNDEALTLPHPRLQHRAFVVFPLLELSPEYCVPCSSSRLSDLAHTLVGQGLRKLRNNA
jgi:2-amino-4-hydroxy-6-hydroxymethyldihydropteridine diphosphokinase